jgi:type II secretory pathway component GspD/PulD (secretin)
VLFSLFTDDEDYEVLESVISQLEDTKDKKIFVKCLLKAFPKLVNKAKNWATAFIYILQKDKILALVKKSNDKIGKQSIVDYINKHVNFSKPTSRHLLNEEAMEYYIKNIENFKKTAKEIEKSMA